MRSKFPLLRKIILLAGDIGIVILSTYLAVMIVFHRSTVQANVTTYYNMLPVMIFAAAVLFNVNGLLSLARKKLSEVILSLAVALFKLFVVMMAASFYEREFSYSRSVLVVTMLLQFVLLGLWKYLFWRAEQSLITPKKVLVVGSKEECQRIVMRLDLFTHLNYTVKYVCTDCGNEPWEKVAEDIDLIIVCGSFDRKAKADIVHFCHINGKQVFIMPDYYDVFCSDAGHDKIDDIPVFRPRYLKPTLEQRSLKRLLDIIVAGIALFLTWPIILLVAIAIKLDSPGPILYSQIRTGRKEKEFKVYKFRSMSQDAEKNTGPVLASESDTRITRVGNFIRATRLDELPQIFNVLKGDMSIVGPRPERPFFVEQFKQQIPEYIYRHNVKPGITGLAQIFGKYNTTPHDKLIYDLIYIQKCNVITDLIIMLQTVRVLVTKSSTEGVNANKGKVTDLTRYEINEAG